MIPQQNLIRIMKVKQIKSRKMNVIYDEVVSLDDSTAKSLNSMNFQSKVIQLFSSVIPIFDAKILKVQKDDYVVPSY